MGSIYQLKIELVGSNPTIWRRITVPGNSTFEQMHDLIQMVMGWENEYPFEFHINKIIVRDFGPAIDMGEDPNDRDVMDTFLDDLITMEKTKFTYVYNLYDHWEHQITLEKILPADEEPIYPFCLGGERACPPDDSGGISKYQEMLEILADNKHPKYKIIKKRFGSLEKISSFSVDNVNDRLHTYYEEWEDILDETEDIIKNLEGRNTDDEFDDLDNLEDFDEDEYENDYESHKHLKSPHDVLNDEAERLEMGLYLDVNIRDKNSHELKTFNRLVNQGYNEDKSGAMILEAYAIEHFYDLKYGIEIIDDRYEYNLNQLPEKPQEIPSIETALYIIDNCANGIPFSAIEYLHNDTSQEATATIVKSLNNYSDHQYCWEDCYSTPIWYSLAAEGHLCEELIDPVIDIYKNEDSNQSDYLYDQGQYLIGKLAQKYPDITTQKVLDAMEQTVIEKKYQSAFYLFDVFYFCDLSKYKNRILGFLKHSDIYWHDGLASTVAFLQIKEALPILKEKLKQFKEQEKTNPDISHHTIDIEEAINQLETGENLYPDVDMPLCLTRNKTWKEEFVDFEENFYETDFDPERGIFKKFSDSFTEDMPFLTHPDDFQQPIIKGPKVGRNDPCPCGSGKKYKKCCMDKDS